MMTCFVWLLHSIGFERYKEEDASLLVNYGLNRAVMIRIPADRRAALRRSMPWRRATHRRLPVEYRRLLVEGWCCWAAWNGVGAGEREKLLATEDVEVIL